MGLFYIARLVTLATSLVFSIIVLGLAADMISITEEYLDSYYIFSALAVATAVLTFVTVLPMIVIDLFRRGAFSSWVVLEVSWLSILWVLWLSTAAYATWTDGQVFIGSSCSFVDSTVSLVCNEFKAVEAFAYLTWILLMAYSVTLFAFAIKGQTLGNKTWTNTVRDATFLTAPTRKDIDAPVLVATGHPLQTSEATPAPVSMSVSPAAQV
ncbi:hypothetical protein BV25DRAFT_94285 [Artomyces pyxidatus]|uniref:Uncharacterized protein n=1 Tax=Artomyces pyxidatus TaxID=48021 RepID=A0ACB8TL28_9AGAM|nr:hypothetical protein BV25DRAFT_94285 [Artomyces pyxidatus]